MRPQHLSAYESSSIFDLAAAYAFGIIKNHPFVDGNKRTGFLALNGWELMASEVDAVTVRDYEAMEDTDACPICKELDCSVGNVGSDKLQFYCKCCGLFQLTESALSELRPLKKKDRPYLSYKTANMALREIVMDLFLATAQSFEFYLRK